jgi:uncharacterized membrane protein
MKIISKIIKIGVILLLILGILKIVDLFNSNNKFEFNLNQTAVVKEIRGLNRLESASFTIEKIIEANKDAGVFGEILFGDKILLIAHADIIAGFDFSKLEEDDINIDNNILTIDMPAAEILVSRLDNEKTRVYDRSLGFLTKGDSQLESQARLMAENTIRKAACEGGIIEVAEDNARKQISTIFNLAGFNEVILNIPTGDCI